ncbi:MAG: 50S ribosomal protein L22 [Candidatus Sungbacteria bacterium]|nr:50S ribosomal protein L22 [Candidatus Sungbacteria bacterium]
MEIKAELNYLRIAPRKVRIVANLISGLSVANAIIQLRHLPKRSSEPLEKLLKSAMANAKHNFSLEDANLRVKQILVDGGPVLKRTMPRAFGRAAMIRKRTSHVTLVLDEVVPTKRKSAKPKKPAAGPEVRQATIEELKEIERETSLVPERREAEIKRVVKPSRPGFVKRIFTRKAI